MTDALVVLLLVLPPADWIVAGILVYSSRKNPSIVTLKERAVVGVILAGVASIAWLLAGVRQGFVFIDNDTAVTLLALCLVAVSLPAVYWLALLVTGRFRMDNER
jgi:hypothetical protein